MPNYKNGKIYKIVCNTTGETYYGSTTQPLWKRMGHHRCKTNSANSKQIIERGNYDYVLVEEYPCDNKEQLHKRERYYIENNECINITIPTRTNKEYCKYWRENNKEYDKERRDKYKEQDKKYQEQMKEKVICECGCKVAKSWLREHKKTDIHKNIMLV